MKKQQETNNEQKYLKGSATEDICVSVSNNDKDVKSASLEVETAGGTLYIKGFARKSKNGKWFFSAPSHKYNGEYVNDVFGDKALFENINTEINDLLS